MAGRWVGDGALTYFLTLRVRVPGPVLWGLGIQEGFLVLQPPGRGIRKGHGRRQATRRGIAPRDSTCRAEGGAEWTLRLRPQWAVRRHQRKRQPAGREEVGEGARALGRQSCMDQALPCPWPFRGTNWGKGSQWLEAPPTMAILRPFMDPLPSPATPPARRMDKISTSLRSIYHGPAMRPVLLRGLPIWGCTTAVLKPRRRMAVVQV